MILAVSESKGALQIDPIAADSCAARESKLHWLHRAGASVVTNINDDLRVN